MAHGQLYIRRDNTLEWIDAYDEWHLSLSDGALTTLLTPASAKEQVNNTSRLEHGRRYQKTEALKRKEARDVSLNVHFTAGSKKEYLNLYEDFCKDILENEFFEIKTPLIPDKVFRFVYQSTSSFTSFMYGIGKYTLRLVEPNPEDRGEEPLKDTSSYTNDYEVLQERYKQLQSRYEALLRAYNSQLPNTPIEPEQPKEEI